MLAFAVSEAVILNVYAPAVVAGVMECDPDPDPEPPPHPITPAANTANTRTRRLVQRRRRGTPRNSANAKTGPAYRIPQNCGRENGVTEALTAAVVIIVMDAVAVPPLESFSVPGFRLQPGRLCAPAGELVSAHVRFIVPAYVLPAASVRVEVPELPAETVAGADAAAATTATVMFTAVLLTA